MLAKVYSCAILGLDGQVIEVEVDKRGGMANFIMVGLPDTAVQESRVRVRAAIRNSGLSFPMGTYTVNLAPANIPKRGPSYDLPIAVGVLASTEQVPLDALEDAMFIGELALDGALRHVNGILPMAGFARRQGYKRLYVPEVDAAEAARTEGPAAAEKMLRDHLADLEASSAPEVKRAIPAVHYFLARMAENHGDNDRAETLYSKMLSAAPSDARALYGVGRMRYLAENYSSAAEIFAGSLQDWDKAVVAGKRTFGKGSVQQLFPLGDSTGVKITTAHYYIKSGRCIHKRSQDKILMHKSLTQSEKDSIIADQGRVFHTVGGRIVYGGGGIKLDIYACKFEFHDGQ